MKTITIDIAEKTVEYFKDIAETTGIPYQTLIGMYLTAAWRTTSASTYRGFGTKKTNGLRAKPMPMNENSHAADGNVRGVFSFKKSSTHKKKASHGDPEVMAKLV